jgi:hypothetical protein
MALVGFWGFDDTVVESNSNTPGTSGVTGRSGLGLAARRNAGTLLVMSSFTGLSSLWCGVAVRFGSLGNAPALHFIAPDGTTIHCSVGITSGGALVIYGPGGSTVVATSATGLISTGTWYYLEAHVVIHDTTGVVEVRLGETVVLTYNGDTRNGAATTVAFISDRSPVAVSNGADFDDHYVDDAAYQGDITVVTLLPDGNGSSSGWTGSDGNSTDNYLLVDDSPTPNVTDYVAASVSGTQDLYSMGDMPAGYSVIAIQELIYAQKSDAGTPPTLLPVAKGALGTVRTDTALPTLSTTAQLVNAQIRTTDPDGNPLTAARVNAMEVGVQIS